MSSIDDRSRKLQERFNGITISEELRQQILPYVTEPSLVLGNSDVAAVITSRSKHGTSGGIGYYDQVRVFWGSQNQLQEWQWRDCDTADKDRPELGVHSLSRVTAIESNGVMKVEVRLVNDSCGSRIATYTFMAPNVTSTRVLSANEQATLTASAQREMSRILEELNKQWKLKGTMMSSSASFSGEAIPTRAPYHQPLIREHKICAEIGVVAFVTEEQIDHRLDDPQMQHKLYILTHEIQSAREKAEDHGYNKQGGALITILEIEPNHIIIDTKKGRATISL